MYSQNHRNLAGKAARKRKNRGRRNGIFRAKIFDLVAPAGQFLADLKEIGLCTAAGVEKFIDE